MISTVPDSPRSHCAIRQCEVRRYEYNTHLGRALAMTGEV
jgi:hypothetical protein